MWVQVPPGPPFYLGIIMNIVEAFSKYEKIRRHSWAPKKFITMYEERV